MELSHSLVVSSNNMINQRFQGIFIPLLIIQWYQISSKSWESFLYGQGNHSSKNSNTKQYYINSNINQWIIATM